LSSSRDDYDQFKAVEAEVIGISADAKFSQQAFADFLKLNFPLLSDAPDQKTIQAYGVLNPQSKLAQRLVFIVDSAAIRCTCVGGERLVPNERLSAIRRKQ
jgi:peroxiredoxin Q/BCP